MTRPFSLCVVALPLLLSLPAWAQGGGGGGGGGPGGGGPGDGKGGNNPAGMLGVAVVMPTGTQRARLVAQRADQGDAVAFTDDGSISLDMPGDGEWWALLNPAPGSTTIHISGVADGVRVWHTEIVTVPMAWRETTYPLTLIATQADGEWLLSRSLTAVMPKPAPMTGSGLSNQAERAGVPAPIFYLGFGVMVFLLAMTAALRSAILVSRR